MTRYQKWYEKNKERESARAAVNRLKMKAANREKLWAYFLEHPCVDCDEVDPVVLEFDHLRDKEIGISKLLGSSYSWTRILAEIEKCEVVCCNCHRRRTFIRCGSWRIKPD